MGTITLNLPSDGTTADVADVNTNFTTIANAINGNLDNANIAAAAAITPDKLAGGNASMLAAFTSYTPTWTNVTLGSSTQASSYVQIGKIVTVKIAFTFGAGTAITGAVSFTLPVTAKSTHVLYQSLGTINANDSDTTLYPMIVSYASTTTASLGVQGAAGTYVNIANTSSTVPFTWATGDKITGMFTYEAA